MPDSNNITNPAPSISNKSLPRVRVMMDLLLLPVATLFLGLIVSYLGSLIVQISTTETQHFIAHLPVIILFIAGSLAIVILFTNFVKMFAQLSEIERYLMLLFFAICSSALVGFLNHHIYLINKNAFFIDENLRRQVTAQQSQDREAKMQRSQRIMSICKDVISELVLMPAQSFGTSQVTHDSASRTVQVRLDLPNTTIQITKGGWITSGKTAVPVNDSVSVVRGGDGVELGESPHSGLVLQPLINDLSSIKKADLIATLQYRMELENKYVLPVHDASAIMPASLFAYQAAMETLGGSENYFTPANALTRAVAFVHTAAKCAFFGLFITILIGRQKSDGKRS